MHACISNWCISITSGGGGGGGGGCHNKNTALLACRHSNVLKELLLLHGYIHDMTRRIFPDNRLIKTGGWALARDNTVHDKTGYPTVRNVPGLFQLLPHCTQLHLQSRTQLLLHTHTHTQDTRWWWVEQC